MNRNHISLELKHLTTENEKYVNEINYILNFSCVKKKNTVQLNDKEQDRPQQ